MKINNVGLAANQITMAIEAVSYMLKCCGTIEVRSYKDEKYIDVYNPNGWDKEYILHSGEVLHLIDDDGDHV